MGTVDDDAEGIVLQNLAIAQRNLFDHYLRPGCGNI